VKTNDEDSLNFRHSHLPVENLVDPSLWDQSDRPYPTSEAQRRVKRVTMTPGCHYLREGFIQQSILFSGGIRITTPHPLGYPVGIITQPVTDEGEGQEV
jgi:hypothetical protein